MVATIGLCRQRRGEGVACPGNWRAVEACAGEAIARGGIQGRDANLHAAGRAGAATCWWRRRRAGGSTRCRAAIKAVYTSYTLFVLLLRRLGLAVLVHGVEEAPKGVTSAAIPRALDFAPAARPPRGSRRTASSSCPSRT